MAASKTLADLRAITRLRMDSASNVQIAGELGCSDRTVRRDLDALYRRACAAGILGGDASLASGVAARGELAVNDAPLAKEPDLAPRPGALRSRTDPSPRCRAPTRASAAR